MTTTLVTCGDILSSPIHSAYNYSYKILNYCFWLSSAMGGPE